MTVETPPALAIRPLTHAGAGLTVPIAKALAHLMLVNLAIEAEWGISAATARAEIGEAASHLQDLYFGNGLLTDDLRREIETWMVDVHEWHRDLSRRSIPEPDEGILEEDDLVGLRTTITQTMALLALIDRELTGLPTTQADPGSRP
jgi:hypothetical protein